MSCGEALFSFLAAAALVFTGTSFFLTIVTLCLGFGEGLAATE